MLKSFFHFLIDPVLKEDDGILTWKHLKMIFTIIFFYYLIQGVFFLFLKLIDGNLFNRTFDLLKQTFTGENYVHPMYVVIIGPILEDIQFRLPMDLKKNSICIGLAIFLGNLLMRSLHIPLFYDEFQIIALLEFFFVYGVLFFVFSWIHTTFLYNW